MKYPNHSQDVPFERARFAAKLVLFSKFCDWEIIPVKFPEPSTASHDSKSKDLKAVPGFSSTTIQ